MSTIIFDLDGTISDPAVGITRSINHALAELGCETRPEISLHRYIGPSLHVTFSELTGRSDEDFLARAVEVYRERYIPIGYKESVIYPGMEEALTSLRKLGHTLCIATSKRQDIARKVVDYLGLGENFTQIHGCDVHESKASLLRKMLDDESLNQPMIMVGDRDNDFEAAREVGIPSVAVRWGYGNEAEYGLATASVSDPVELVEVTGGLLRNIDQEDSFRSMIIRRYRSGEERAIWDVYFRATHESNSRDYHSDLINRWAPKDQDMGEWEERCARQNPFVAIMENRIVAMAELEADGFVDYFYVSPEFQGKGVGSSLLARIEADAATWGLSELTAQVSVTAKGFFESRGFIVTEARQPVIMGHPAPCFAMSKCLKSA